MGSTRKRTKPGVTVTYDQLDWAIRWESLRNQWYTKAGNFEQAAIAGKLTRLYQQRAIDEADY